jgi:endonuclease YncB( thermonuclease family)
MAKRILSFALTAWLSIAPVFALDGRVVAVADGDTITVLDDAKQQHRIRLAEIDAPEKKQDFGARSKESLAELVFNQRVRVVETARDRYGRTVGVVFAGPQNVNLEQVKRGMAWAYLAYATDPVYAQAENEARRSRLGLWTKPNAVPPWEYRKSVRGQER